MLCLWLWVLAAPLPLASCLPSLPDGTLPELNMNYGKEVIEQRHVLLAGTKDVNWAIT